MLYWITTILVLLLLSFSFLLIAIRRKSKALVYVSLIILGGCLVTGIIFLFKIWPLAYPAVKEAVKELK